MSIWKANEFPFFCRSAKTSLSPSRKDCCVNPPPYETDDANTETLNMRVRSSGTQYKYQHKKHQKKINSLYSQSKKQAPDRYNKFSSEKPKKNSLVSLYRSNNNWFSRYKECCGRIKRDLTDRTEFGLLPGTLGLSAGDGKLLKDNDVNKPQILRKTAKTKKEIKKTQQVDVKSDSKTCQEVCKKLLLDPIKNNKIRENLDNPKHVQFLNPVPDQNLQKYFLKFDYTPRNTETLDMRVHSSAPDRYKNVSSEKPQRKSLVSLYRSNNNWFSRYKENERTKRDLTDGTEFGNLPGTLGLSAGDGKLLKRNDVNKPEILRKTAKTKKEIKKPQEVDVKSDSKISQEDILSEKLLLDQKKTKKVRKNLDKPKHVQFSKPVPNQCSQNYFLKFDYTPRKNPDTRRWSSGDAKQASNRIDKKKELNSNKRKQVQRNEKGKREQHKTEPSLRFVQCICELQKILGSSQAMPADNKKTKNVKQKTKNVKQKTKNVKHQSVSICEPGCPKLVPSAFCNAKPNKNTKNAIYPKSTKENKKKNDDLCVCEMPKNSEKINENNISLPVYLQSLCHLIQRLQACVDDKIKQAKPDNKSQDRFIIDEKNIKAPKTNSADKGKKSMKSNPQLNDKRICGDGVCANVVKNSNFSCKCVERKRPNTCNEMTCKVPLPEVSIIKRKKRCLCHKYSKKFKGKDLIDNENRLGFCSEDDKSVALCRQAYLGKYANFKCTCMKPQNLKECTDETCQISKEPSAIISRLSKLPIVGKALVEAISKADDCFVESKRKLTSTISAFSVNSTQNNIKPIATESSNVLGASNTSESKNVSKKSADLIHCSCEKGKRKCLCSKYKKKTNKKRVSSPASREMLVQSSVTPVISDQGPRTLENKPCTIINLNCIYTKFKSIKKVQKILAIFKRKGKLRKCRRSTCSKYTNTALPRTTPSKTTKKTSSISMVSMVLPSTSTICQCNLMKSKEKHKPKPKKALNKKQKKTKKPKQKKKQKPKPKQKKKPKQKPKQKPKPKPKPKKKPNKKAILKEKAKQKRKEQQLKLRNKALFKLTKKKRKEEAKVNKKLLKIQKRNKKLQDIKRNRQIAQLIRLTQGKEDVKETNFAVEFCTEVCKMLFASVVGIVKALFQLIFYPRQSLHFIKQSILHPMSTKQDFTNWLEGHMTMFKLKMEKAIAGSEKMIIMEDACKDSAIYQSFAARGKNKSEQRKLELEQKQRRKRIAKRDQDALYGCRHILLTTLRKRPCIPGHCPVYNVTSGSINPLQWGEFTNLCVKWARENPTKYVMWYPNFSFTESRFLNSFWEVTCHFIPAFLYDLLLKAQGRKAIMMKIARRFKMAAATGEYFANHEWQFGVSELTALRDDVAMTCDGNAFFHWPKFDWDTYIGAYMMGIRRFILKDSIDSLAAARNKLNRLYWVHHLFQAATWFYYIRLLSGRAR